MPHLDETRRRFMTHFATIGLGTTLAPGIIWARMQDAGEKRITLEMVVDAMKLSGASLTCQGSARRPSWLAVSSVIWPASQAASSTILARPRACTIA